MSQSTHRLLVLTVLALSSGMFSESVAFSQTRTWMAPDAGNLLSGANWSGGVAPNGVGQKAVISTNPLPNQTGFWLPDNSELTLGTLEHSNPRESVILGLSSRLIMAASSGNALFQVSQGRVATTLGEIQLQSNTVFDLSGLGGTLYDEHSIDGAITGSGSLIKTGPDRVQLLGNNSYTGATDIRGGAVRGYSIANAGIDSSFGRGNFSLSNGGTLMYTGPDATTDRTVTLGEGGGGFSIVNSLTLSRPISGQGSLQLHSGTLIVSFRNSYTGSTDIGDATLKSSAGHFIPDQSAVRMLHPNATIDFVHRSDRIGSLSGVGRVLLGGSSLVTGLNDQNTVFDGTISGDGGNLIKAGQGIFTLTNANTYTGPVDINTGTLHLKDAGSISESELVRVRSAAALWRTGGDLANSHRLDVDSGGEVLLYDNTLFNTGTINNNGYIQGNVIVDAGGVLNGTGTIDGNLSIGSGGTLSPGNSPGTMNVAGNATWEGNGSYTFEINDALGNVSANWDLLAIAGTLDLTATPANPFAIEVRSLSLANLSGEAANFDPLQAYAWTLATADGGIHGFNPLAFVVDLSNFTNAHEGSFAVAQLGNSLQLVYSVPEPGTFVLALLAGAGGGLGRRRRLASRSK